MINNTFREELISELYNGGIRRKTLLKYKKMGIDQDTMFNVMDSLRDEMRKKDNEKLEDDIMDAMDLVVGYCNPQLKLFPEQDLIELRNSFINEEDDIYDASMMLAYIITPLLSDDVIRQFKSQIKSIRHMRNKMDQRDRFLALIDEAITKVNSER